MSDLQKSCEKRNRTENTFHPELLVASILPHFLDHLLAVCAWVCCTCVYVGVSVSCMCIYRFVHVLYMCVDVCMCVIYVGMEGCVCVYVYRYVLYMCVCRCVLHVACVCHMCM